MQRSDMNRPDEHIITHFLQGCCSEEELLIVKSWVDSSEDNANELFGMEHIYRQVQTANISKEHTEKALDNVLGKCRDEEYSVKPSYNIGWLKYAAVLAFILLVGGGLMYKAGLLMPSADILIAYGDNIKEVTLADGTHVWLNKGAELRYPETFDGEERHVTLEGEGYFEVAKDLKRPFLVKGDVMTVKVLGTKFNFKTHKLNHTAEVSLIEGSVGVNYTTSNEMVVLSPGQKAEIDSNKMLKIIEINAPLAALWHDNLIHFNKSNVSAIANTLEEVYGMKVIVKDGVDEESTYSGVVPYKGSVDSLMLLLKNTLPIDYNIIGNTITVFPSCEVKP